MHALDPIIPLRRGNHNEVRIAARHLVEFAHAICLVPEHTRVEVVLEWIIPDHEVDGRHVCITDVVGACAVGVVEDTAVFEEYVYADCDFDVVVWGCFNGDASGGCVVMLVVYMLLKSWE